MKLKLTLAAALVATFALTACGSSDDSPVQVPPPPAVVTNPTAFASKDVVIGGGAEAAVGKTIGVVYSGWLYDSSKPDNKGKLFDSNVGKGVFSTPLTKEKLIEGWVQGVPGMKVGGKRTLTLPASLGYGAGGSGATIPPNAGLVFDIELVDVK